jgi:outer membrane receptor protein involved in Fe transport
MLSRGFVSTAIVGAYVQDEWRLAKRWTLNLGARMDYDSYGGFQPSARAALSYRVTDDTALYAAVSRAFHQWPGAGWFLDIPVLDGLGRVTSRPNLITPTLWAYELGYRGRYLDSRLDVGLNLFWHELSDVYTLSPRPGPPALLHVDIDTRGGASLYGVELDARLNVTDKLTLLGHYTYQQLDWRVSAPVHDKDMIAPPDHKAMIGARYDLLDDLSLSGHLYYVDATKSPNPANPFIPRRVPAYLRLDLLAEYAFWNERAAVSVGVRNLLDSHHYEGGSSFLNDAEVPRMIYAELRLRID